MLVTALNFLLATDPNMVGDYSIHIMDFLIGAVAGVFTVQLIEYMRGLLFVESQDESTFIAITAIVLHIIGIITWTFVCYIVSMISKEVISRRERAHRRVAILNRM